MALDQQSLELLRKCSENQSPVYLSAKGVDYVFQTIVRQVEKGYLILRNTIKPEFISKVCHAEKVQLQAHMTRFQAEGIQSDGVHIIFPVDTLQIIEETREDKRFPFDAEERVICELTNPFDKVTKLSKSVMDMSASGLSISTSQPSALFSPGTNFDDIQITIDGQPYSRTSARVVYSRKLIDLEGKVRIQVGLQVTEPNHLQE